MEVINCRFSHIAEKILKHVQNQSFFNFKESSKGNYNFINGEKKYWVTILQNCCQTFTWYSEYWKKICRTGVIMVLEGEVAVPAQINVLRVRGIVMTMLIALEILNVEKIIAIEH